MAKSNKNRKRKNRAKGVPPRRTRRDGIVRDYDKMRDTLAEEVATGPEGRTSEQLVEAVFGKTELDPSSAVDQAVKSELTRTVDESLEQMEQAGIVRRGPDGGWLAVEGEEDELNARLAGLTRSREGTGEFALPGHTSREVTGEFAQGMMDTLREANEGKGPVAGGLQDRLPPELGELDVTLRVTDMTDPAHPRLEVTGPQADEWRAALGEFAAHGDPTDDRVVAARQILKMVDPDHPAAESVPKDRARLLRVVADVCGGQHDWAQWLLTALGPGAGITTDGALNGAHVGDVEAWEKARAFLVGKSEAEPRTGRHVAAAVALIDAMDKAQATAMPPSLRGPLEVTPRGEAWHEAALGTITGDARELHEQLAHDRREAAFLEHLDGSTLKIDVSDPEAAAQVAAAANDHTERSRELAREWTRRGWPEDEPYEEAVALELAVPVELTYVGLANLVAEGVARQAEVTCRITERELRQAATKAKHQVIAAWRVSYGGVTRVRLGLKVELRTGTHEPRLHDVAPTTWEMLAGEGPEVPVRQTVRAELHGTPDQYRLGSGDRPRWAGARAFDRVWDRLSMYAQLGHQSVDTGRDLFDLVRMPDGAELNTENREQIKGTVGYSLTGLQGLVQSQEVLIDPDQVNAMPGFDSWDHAQQFARDVALPFGQTFLDMEGPARSCAIARGSDSSGGDEEVVLAVRGAHVMRGEDGRLAIMPYGSLCKLRSIDSEQSYNPLGLFVFDGERPNDGSLVWATQAVLDDGYMHKSLAADPAVARTPLDAPGHERDEEGEYRWLVGFLNGEDTEPTGSAAYTVLDADMEVDYSRLGLAVSALTAGAMVALRALYLIDMSNVEVEQAGPSAGVTRQVRRQAERRGEAIALAVVIHTSSKRYNGSREGDGQRHVEYSHRFRVRGHVKHYGMHTRMAQSAPDKVKPCERCTRCRRVYTPPFIKGPDDKPLVLKSLVVK